MFVFVHMCLFAMVCVCCAGSWFPKTTLGFLKNIFYDQNNSDLIDGSGQPIVKALDCSNIVLFTSVYEHLISSIHLRED